MTEPYTPKNNMPTVDDGTSDATRVLHPRLHSLTVKQVGEQIRIRLTEHLRESGVDFQEYIHDDMSFDYIGLDSLARVNLMAALDKEFGVRLDPAAAYDFVTVGALSTFVWSEVTGTPLDIKKVLEV